MTATDELRRLLDERGVEYMLDQRYRELFWDFGESGRARASAIGTKGFVQMIVTGLTPEQAIAATLGNRYDCDHPEWVEWVDSLNHRKVKSIRDAVEKLMYESITLGGSMGPNDIIEDGWNEGTELTKAYIDSWVETFATLGDADERNFKLFEAAKKWMAKSAHFEAENAKLRELVESYGMIANEAVCDYYDRDEMLADANATACELGIEVPE